MTFSSVKGIVAAMVGAVLFIALISIVPTGWIYDICLATGTGQGLWADGTVKPVTNAGEIMEAYYHNLPVTVTGDDFIACPLLRLRSRELKGEHTVRRRGRRNTYTITEYWTMSYPPTTAQEIVVRCFGEGMYNRYYLHKLDDGTYLCVYMDDYLLLRNFIFGNRYQAGRVRHAQSYEQRMLKKMSADYDVPVHYILDMYREGKQPGYLDLLLRLAFGVAVIAAYFAAGRLWQRGKRQR